MRVAIIGGGASGLVQLKVLTTAHKHFPTAEPFEAKLFESYGKVGGVFLHHTYEDGELVSSKFITTFSDFRPKPEDNDFFSPERYVEYLEDYATHFELWPYINLSTYVTGVRRGDNSEHVVSYKGPDGQEIEWECDAIAVCSGVHSSANIPHVPGIEHVPQSIHSEEIKTRDQFGKDTTVMVLGSGETGADMAYLGVTSPTKRIVFCHRDGWIGAPKRIAGQRFLPWLFGDQPPTHAQLPIDVSQITLFDSMYVHPWIRDSMIIWDYYHFVALSTGCWLCGGSQYGMEQYVGQIFSERFHASRLFWNKGWQRIQNYVAHRYRPKTWPLSVQIRRFFFNTRYPPPPRTIEVAPFPTHFTSDGVAHFPLNDRVESQQINQTVVKPDIVIFATGYVPSFPFLNTLHNQNRRPYPTAHDTDVRSIWKSDDPTVAFIGFVRPGFGAIPPLAELQAMLFTTNLLGRVPRPLSIDDEWHYRILTPPDARVFYGVEHDSYAYQLAKDMDIAPSFTDILRISLQTRRGYRLPYIWAGGACLNPKFRLTGPWKWDGAAEVMTGELWQTVSRRESLWSNIPLSVIPMICLGSLNLCYYLCDGIWSGLAKIGLATTPKHVIQPKLILEQMALKRKMMEQQKVVDVKLNGDANGSIASSSYANGKPTTTNGKA